MQGDGDTLYDKSTNTSVVGGHVKPPQSVIGVNTKPPQSVVGSSNNQNAAVSTSGNAFQSAANVLASRSAAPAFDQGPRTVAPVSYKEPKKTVPTPNEEFVVDEMKQAAKKPAPVEKVEVKESPKPVEEPKPAPTLPLSLNKLRMNHQKLVTPPQPVKIEDGRIMFSDLKVRPLPKGKTFTAACLTGDPSAKILFITEFSQECTEYMDSIATKIMDFVSTQTVTSYKPIKNEVVLASYEERYYRAVCRASTKVDDKRHYSVQFIDYGDQAQVTEEFIRPFDKSLKFEVVTHAVKFLNMPNNEEQLAKLLETGNAQVKDVKDSDEEGASYTANFVM